MTLHILSFEGGNALSPLRARQLLAQLQAVDASICAVAARHVHLVAVAGGVEPAEALDRALDGVPTFHADEHGDLPFTLGAAQVRAIALQGDLFA